MGSRVAFETPEPPSSFTAVQHWSAYAMSDDLPAALPSEH